MKYDLIGDIHGYSRPLVELLGRLGYKQSDGVYRHPDRQVIFLGDFIDRGPDQRGVLDVVRPMIDGGAALSVMGNHEFNAMAWFTLDPDDHSRHLRDHSDKHRGQHQAFLDAFAGTDDYAEIIEWFRTLPLWLKPHTGREHVWSPRLLNRSLLDCSSRQVNSGPISWSVTVKASACHLLLAAHMSVFLPCARRMCALCRDVWSARPPTWKGNAASC